MPTSLQMKASLITTLSLCHRDQKIEAFVTVRTGGDESDIANAQVWIEDKRFWGPTGKNRLASASFVGL